jgi:hypothetical protein
VRPERYFQWLARERGETEADFIARFQTSPHSLRAFEQSFFSEDWQDLMRLFLVRRTRQFIIRHYAESTRQAAATTSGSTVNPTTSRRASPNGLISQLTNQTPKTSTPGSSAMKW